MYYSEEIEKDTKYRQEYVEGIDAFLNLSKKKADKIRGEYITPEKYKNNPEKFRKALVEQLGYPLTTTKEMPLLKEKKFVSKDGNVNIYRMQFEFFGFLKFYGLYLEQTENSQEKPFVLGLHGGDGTPELVSSIYSDSANYNHLVRRITDKGASVFVPQLLLWKQDIYGNNYNRHDTDGKFRQLGGSITAFEVYLMQCCIDYFIKYEKINVDRIGVAGLSYGGMYAAHLAAVDTRIKVCYSCSWANDVFVVSWEDWSYKCAQKRFTTAETLALIAPRALVVAMGDKDELFDSKLMVKECEKVKPYYSIFGKDDDFKYITFNGTHESDKSDEEIDFLFDNLCK